MPNKHRLIRLEQQLVALCLLFASIAHASSTDVAQVPLITSATTTVRPNFMFILDDSGSMDWDFLPDWLNYTAGGSVIGACKLSDGAASNGSINIGSSKSHCCRNGSNGEVCLTGNTDAPTTRRPDPPMASSDINSAYYNPAITYTPPNNGNNTSKPSVTNYTAVKLDAYGVQWGSTKTINLTTSYPDPQWCTDSGKTNCVKNNNYYYPNKTFNYLDDGSTGAAHYYTIIPGEYCNSEKLTTCIVTTAPSGAYTYPAKLRWCSNTSLTTCQAIRTATYQYPRYPTVAPSGYRTANITVSGSTTPGNNKLSSVTIGAPSGAGSAILSTATATSQDVTVVADRIIAGINAGTSYQASPKVCAAGTCTILLTVLYENPCPNGAISSPVAYSGGGPNNITVSVSNLPNTQGCTVPGRFVRTDIIAPASGGSNTYVLPGTNAKAATRTDCGNNSTCDYAQEMTNFANWYTYYRTRMQMAKSSASLAFAGTGDTIRVGYMSINNNGGSSFLNINKFDSTQKTNWYNKLFAASANNGTPLRSALSTAGLLYAGKLNGNSFNGSTVVDPVEYSCQQNFTLLTTDGYWNTGSDSACSGRSGAGCRMDKTSAIDNPDNSDPQNIIKDVTPDTLADTAYYYYTNDLRTSGPLSTNNVPVNASSGDTASHQHMTTFTLGLGIDGFMKYRADYRTATSGDYYDIRISNVASASACTWQPVGSTCRWPWASSNSQANIDDLWHAAVNGRGLYYSTRNPKDLAEGIADTLAAIATRTGAASAATTSTSNIIAGDNFEFRSTFLTNEWTGQLMRNDINLTTGEVGATPVWTAMELLDGKVGASTDTRTIYTYTTDTNTSYCGTAIASDRKLKPFCWSGSGSAYPSDTSLTTTEQTYFTQPTITSLVQFCPDGQTYSVIGIPGVKNCLSTAQKNTASGKTLLNFLRGQTQYEDEVGAVDRLFRDRTHALGDLVNSKPSYIKQNNKEYNETLNKGYTAFRSSQASRTGMVYVGGNDGMLHAFNATTGQETWAHIPSMVLPNLYKLADINYPNSHRFYVDGQISIGDICVSGCGTASATWKTVLVGGLGAGGNGYYALDITDPATPRGMWEFKQRSTSCAATVLAAIGDKTDCDMGLSYSTPIIGKLRDGTWIVVVPSGHNNVSPGSGEGFVYVLNAVTGEIIRKIGTGVGSTSTISGVCETAPCPSGLAKLAAWVEDPRYDTTIERIYGGDLFGNLWRFDINDILPPSGYEALKVATVTGPNGLRQPITSKPTLASDEGVAMVLFGTGRYLGGTDNAAVDQTPPNNQSIWGIRDKVESPTWTGWGDIRTSSPRPVQQVFTDSVDSNGAAIRNGTTNPVDISVVPGWFVDLPDAGERVDTDALLALSTLAVITNVPTSSACTAGGYSYLNLLDFRNGWPVIVDASRRTGKVSTKYTSAMSSAPTASCIGLSCFIGRTGSDGSPPIKETLPPRPSGQSQRVSWRQLLDND